MGDPQAVQRVQSERLEDQEIESTLQQVHIENLYGDI